MEQNYALAPLITCYTNLDDDMDITYGFTFL